MAAVKKPLKQIKMPSRASDSAAVSGANMDKKIAVKTPPLKKWLPLASLVLLIGYFSYNALTQFEGRSLQVETKRIIMSTVQTGKFEDFIPIRASIVPAKTVYLDAIEGGRVERILVEEGALVSAGDLLVELSNTSLQLSVTQNEAMVAEQLNNMRSIELSLEQNRLNHKRNLVELNYQIKKLTRQAERQKLLVERGTIANTNYQDTQDELEYLVNRKEVTLESQSTDAKMQQQQLSFLKTSGDQLKKNLQISRNNLDAMNVRAPLDGKLSGFDVEQGQSISPGGRLGQIDNPDDYKLSSSIDEFYISRTNIGQNASFEKNGIVYQAQISKIYPQVKNGQFEVDLKFVDEQPSLMRRGQTVQAKLTLGDANETLIIPNGAFFQDTGGNWIFVVTADGKQAVKRNIKLGRRNNLSIEVIEGLEIGEKVIISPYSSYQNIELIKLTNS